MQKVICDICGTSYSDTLENCPICGAAREPAPENQEPVSEESRENPSEDTPEDQRKNRFAQIFREEFYDSEEEDEPVLAPKASEPPEAPEPGRSGWIAVIALSLVIVLLLGAAGFLFFRFYLPHQLRQSRATEETTAETTLEQPTATEAAEPTVPCKSIVLTAGVPEISRIGQYWLLHVMVLPENTTDQLVFISSDENVVTVTDEGRLCAVGEGETTVVISCGMEEILCQVVVKLPEETAAAQAPQEASEETEAPSETEAPTQQTTAEARGDVVLKLKQSDISFSKKGVTFQLELDCDLKPEEVEWFTMDPDIALCHDGLLTVVGSGTTRIGCRYGDQEVFCIVRCNLG